MRGLVRFQHCERVLSTWRHLSIWEGGGGRGTGSAAAVTCTLCRREAGRFITLPHYFLCPVPGPTSMLCMGKTARSVHNLLPLSVSPRLDVILAINSMAW